MKALARSVLAGLFLLAFAVGAHAAPFFPTTWYWIVGDTSPTADVWNGTTGALVANTDPTYQAWVGGLAPFGTTPSNSAGNAAAISASANNGSGLVRLFVSQTITFTTGDVLVVNGTGTVADGTWTITVVDANCSVAPAQTCRVDLQGSLFSGGSALTGILGGGTKINTMAGLLAFIDQYNKTLWSNGAFLAKTPRSSTARRRKV